MQLPTIPLFFLLALAPSALGRGNPSILAGYTDSFCTAEVFNSGSVPCGQCVTFNRLVTRILTVTPRGQHNIYKFYSENDCKGKAVTWYGSPGLASRCRDVVDIRDDPVLWSGVRSGVINCAQDVL